VTPPFSGYVSCHSTYSRAASEVLTLLTGDPYFPGGVGEFVAKQNEFLVFEEGPSVDIVLQWATYYDASAQTSLARGWGGIHPPVDDIPGRLMGMEVGQDAFAHAEKYFQGLVTSLTGELEDAEMALVYPNPATDRVHIKLASDAPTEVVLIASDGKVSRTSSIRREGTLDVSDLAPGIYFLRMQAKEDIQTVKIVVN
jgi:hypothetical protein